MDLDPLPHRNPQPSPLLAIQQPHLRPPLRHVQRESDSLRRPEGHRRQRRSHRGFLLEPRYVRAEGRGERDVGAVCCGCGRVRCLFCFLFCMTKGKITD